MLCLGHHRKLFRTQDLSDIKAYLYRQWQRLLLGKVSIQDFTFAKEVKLGTYRSVSVHFLLFHWSSAEPMSRWP